MIADQDWERLTGSRQRPLRCERAMKTTMMMYGTGLGPVDCLEDVINVRSILLVFRNGDGETKVPIKSKKGKKIRIRVLKSRNIRNTRKIE